MTWKRYGPANVRGGEREIYMSSYGFRSKWEDAARELVEELERRAGGRATLGSAAKDFMTREFVERLDAADNPDKLLRLWQGNVDRYIDRTLEGRSHGVPVEMLREDIQYQFGICSELCPAPIGAASGGSSTGGSAKSGKF
jgi:hypothetical protein